jgi:plastocyanin
VVRSPWFEAGGAVVYLVPDQSDGVTLATDTVLIDQRDFSFQPRVRAVLPGTVVRYQNSDPRLHNVFSPPNPGPGFNLGTYPRPESRDYRFVELGSHVILCHIHPEMAAYVLVVQARYRVIVDGEGRFSIPEVSPGRYRLKVWRQHAAPLERDILVAAGRTTDLDLELAPAPRRKG